MVITRTPYRVSFFGGGTDYPLWYKEYGGRVLSTSINKYCYISCRELPPFFEHKYRVVYSIVESVKNIDDIQHPVVKAILKTGEYEKGLEIHHDGDLPARAGLGSSSSFAVGLLHAIKTLNKEVLSKHEMALSAINIEQNIIKENVGSQDQIAASYGGFNQINFYQNEKIEVSKILFRENKERELNDHLMLFFTGITRMASKIAEVQINNIKTKKMELLEMNEIVDEGIKILNSSTLPIEDFGKLLHTSWRIKKTLSPIISNQKIDELYCKAMQNGAIGGKILGAGGGGFILFFVKPEDQQNFKNKFNKLVHVPFAFENSGSKVIFYDPEKFHN